MLAIELPTSFVDRNQKWIARGEMIIELDGNSTWCWHHNRIVVETLDGISILRRHVSDDLQRRILHPPYNDQMKEERSLTSPFAVGNRTLAIIRVSTIDSSTKKTLSDLNNSFFNDDISVKAQFAECSFGQLNWELAPNGLIDVLVNQLIANFESPSNLVDVAQMQVADTLGIDSVSTLADRVVVCIPPGFPKLIASSGVNYWRAVFNSDWCVSLSAAMHELGHTLGLLHANNERLIYGDKTGYMSWAYNSSTWPRRCFNGQNNHYLGWYDSKTISLIDQINYPIRIDLAAFTDFDEASENQPVLLRIASRFFLQYNRCKGMNQDTLDYQNLVTVTEDVGYASIIRAGLDVEDKF